LMHDHAAEGERVRDSKIRFGVVRALIERAIVSYQARRGPRHDPSEPQKQQGQAELRPVRS
jgi:hypothetical protein